MEPINKRGKGGGGKASDITLCLNVDLQHLHVDLQHLHLDLQHLHVDLQHIKVDLLHIKVDLLYFNVDLQPSISVLHLVDILYTRVQQLFCRVQLNNWRSTGRHVKTRTGSKEYLYNTMLLKLYKEAPIPKAAVFIGISMSSLL